MGSYLILGIVVILFGSAFSQTLDLTPAAGMVSEGDGIDIVCTLMTGVHTADVECGLGLVALGTDVENTFDFPDISCFTCTVLAGETVGSVNIPITNDPVVEVAEAGIIDCSGSLTTGVTLNNMASITIMVDADDTELMDIVWTRSPVKIAEVDAGATSTVTLTAEFRDSNGNLAPVEDAINVDVSFPSAADTATVAGLDYTAPTTPVAVMASAMGMGTTSLEVPIEILGDVVPENLELITAVISATPAASIGVGLRSNPSASVLVQDNDKRELVVIKSMTPTPRRSRNDVSMWAITNDGGPGVAQSSLPHNYCDARFRESTIGTTGVLTVIAARPKKSSRSRFQEFTFTKSQDFGGTMIPRTTYGYLTPASHTEKQTPVDSLFGSTLTVYPNALVCTNLDQVYPIVLPFAGKWTRELRWEFIPTGGTKANLMRRRRYDGKCIITLNECSDHGLYIVSRRGRGKKGWVEYIRVILAPCPRDMTITAGSCAPNAAPPCQNGGVFDQVISLCTCPPGFAGVTCEIALERGFFGSNCDFNLDTLDFKDTSKRGKGLLFGFPEPFGCICAAGFTGYDCTEECKRGLYFGASCLQECHCVDDECDPYSGYCANGCKTGYTGPNCQPKA